VNQTRDTSAYLDLSCGGALVTQALCEKWPMIELLKFAVGALVLIGLVKGISYAFNALARRTNMNPKLLTGIVTFIIFIICSMLWSFTDVYQRLSDFAGIPLEK
jgi:hypothetical protein